MTTKKLVLAALLACAFAPALADEVKGPGEARIERRIVTGNGHEIKLEVGAPGEPGPFPGVTMHDAKVVKGAPYSAEMVSERQQNLADGNQISNATRTLSYRDSAGRTRQEMRDAQGELRTVRIRDADGVNYVLNPGNKTATKLPASGEIARIAGERARERIEQLRKEGKLPAQARKGAEGERVIVKRVERADGDGQPRVEEDVRVRIASPRLAGDQGAAVRETTIHLGPVLAGVFRGNKWEAQATTKDLGTREFDGVKATGKLRSYEIPAGEIGNRNPIVVSTESWYAPELQVTVYSRHSDPRSGDIIFRLENLKREEPAAALFAVPSDYTVKDMVAQFKERLEKKAE